MDQPQNLALVVKNVTKCVELANKQSDGQEHKKTHNFTGYTVRYF
jgi:hypothetical protein